MSTIRASSGHPPLVPSTESNAPPRRSAPAQRRTLRIGWLRATLVAACALLASSSDARAEGKGRAHVVEAGQTLWEIAQSYGCKVDELQAVNEIDGLLIQPGQRLRVPRCKQQGGSSSKGLHVLSHEVSSGDTLYEIARRYDTSLDDLRRRNDIKGNVIHPGQTLRVAVGKDGEGRPVAGQSVGSVVRGRLVNGMQLPEGRGYYRRRPHRAWGASHTIHHIRRAIASVRNRLPKVHEVAIGDISTHDGGQLADHRSHQSGRDVDIGLYYKKRPRGYPKSFIRGDQQNLDLQATWALIEALANTSKVAGGVDIMFLDYDLQGHLYKWAKKHGVSKRKLGEILQYPRGESSASGLVRHEPGHATHVHVRFKCPKSDEKCW
ncbi:penicillin-insensitive murein endopeptidase [Haliangium ochraceum]|uniref:Peptidoglycan-binding lysin domain protein n=1 Tax=Haliangium ochraceum (strain DSM 14365 / JCM 11303 / SMP-2) TaxID=502025 RepID=D0LLH2_HALO1|nr:penicillin-insensitive murein endopeptidase [Haliangium ochraceum]ACY13189.1 Peptidoglycan-binding lysin domain protein [Haliangium ochraceum DSM 14365]